MRVLQPCGTPAAYKRHLKAKQATCAECKAAWAARRKEKRAGRRFRGPGRRVQPCGTTAAYQRHIVADERPCAACTAANARRAREEYRAEREKAATRLAVRGEALKYLAMLHPTDYERLLRQAWARRGVVT